VLAGGVFEEDEDGEFVGEGRSRHRAAVRTGWEPGFKRDVTGGSHNLFSPLRTLGQTIFGPALLLALLCGAGVRLAAQEIDVTTVKFTNVRAPNGSAGNWLEADIALSIRPAPGSPGLMVARVRVALTLGCEYPAVAGSERRTEYYHAEAECVALEAGRTDVRFYLPPELAKRDQLHGEPKFWDVAITAGGRAQALGHPATAPALVNAEAHKSFLARATAGSAANDGLLQPQYLTVFANEYPHATPSFVRREPR